MIEMWRAGALDGKTVVVTRPPSFVVQEYVPA